MGNCVSTASAFPVQGAKAREKTSKAHSNAKDSTESTGSDEASTDCPTPPLIRKLPNSEVANYEVPEGDMETAGGSVKSLSITSHVATEFKRDSYLAQAPVSGEELGAIRYAYISKEMSIAEDEARRREGVPIFFVEAEVPGDIEIGSKILSHPLIVEAAEKLFVPVSRVLETRQKSSRFRPSPERKAWYTTVRFIGEDGQDLVPALGGDLLNMASLVENMVESLKLCHKTIPTYLELLREEESGKVRVSLRSGVATQVGRQAVFGVRDCSAAEVEFAGIDGVLTVQCVRVKNDKVVKVVYDSTRLTLATLLRSVLSQPGFVTSVYYQTQEQRVVTQMETGRLILKPKLVELDKDIDMPIVYGTKDALRKTEMRYIPLTELQATRANRLIDKGSFNEATHLLSPRQGKILMNAYRNVSKRTTETIYKPIDEAWKGLQ